MKSESTNNHSISRRELLLAAGAIGVSAAVRPAFGDLPGQTKGVDTGVIPGANQVAFKATPLPLSAVRLTGGPLKNAQELDAKYLLELDPDRMMHYFYVRAGLTPTAPEGYGGWDGDGRNLTGHVAGHYLSAVSLMYAATGDEQFKARADSLVDQMKTVQDKVGNGYLGALDGGLDRFEEVSKGDIRSGGFDLNGLWSPWYVEHKIFAGLRDAYRHAGNQTALAIEVKFAAWVESIVSPLTDDQNQKMLNTEFGGMNEVLADLYADTSDTRWLTLSGRFEHHAVIDPLSRGTDDLAGLHGNTQVPKLIGNLARYVYSGNKVDGYAARFFWEAVVYHHSFATGGHGKDEYFGPADKLSDLVDGRTDESCNVYNMLKMTRTLFALDPDIRYAEFHERALFNHALGSIDPGDGRMCYMVPIGRSVQHEYQDMFESFTCCVGTGMENHALHGDGLYYESGDRLWVNLYVPSTAKWDAAGAELGMNTSFPEGEDATLTLTLHSPKKLTILLRRPSWAGDGFAVTVNGKAMRGLPHPGSYVELNRKWKTGDTVQVSLPKVLHAEPLPDNERRVALMHGPLVLSGDLGPEHTDWNDRPATPIFVAADTPVANWLKPVSGDPGSFASTGVGRDTTDPSKTADVTLTPFYRLHRRTYAAYWDLYTPTEWQAKSAEIAAEQERLKKLEAVTVTFVQPGEMQPERDYNMQGEETMPDRVMGRPGRRSRTWFSFDMPVDSSHQTSVVVTYCTQEFRARTFDVQVDGVRIGQQSIDRSGPGSAPAHFFDVTYPVPADLVKGKQKVTVRFQATGDNGTASVFGVRVIRADEM